MRILTRIDKGGLVFDLCLSNENLTFRMRFFSYSIFLVSSMLTISHIVQAQSPNQESPKGEGEIRVFCNPEILQVDSLKQLRPTLTNGYRVQIFFGKREDAQEKRATFLRQFSDTGAYISYLAPNFRLRVGDFRNRIEAEKFKQSLGLQFQGAYIVKDKIELPPLNVN